MPSQPSAQPGAATGVASIPGANVGTVATGNNLTNTTEIKAAFTADNAGGTAAKSKVFIFPGASPVANATLPAGVTYSGDWPGYADFVAYFASIRHRIAYIRIQTTDTGNFSDRLILNQASPANVSPKFKYIEMSPYRQSTGGTILDTININDIDPIVLWPAMSLAINALNKNSTMTLYIGIDAQESISTLATL